MLKPYDNIKEDFLLVELILAFDSSSNMVREVKIRLPILNKLRHDFYVIKCSHCDS